jgi:peptide/nickel transport system ATP-binding protein
MKLEVQGLSVDFATAGGILTAVRDVGFSVTEGEIVGVVGESGSGKSVTAQAILNILPANGRVRSGDVTLGRSKCLCHGR